MQTAFRKLSSATAHRNPWFSVHVDQVERPGGIQGPFYWIDMKPGASVLPLTPEMDVYLVREYKYPMQRASLEAVSGGIEDGETPGQSAERELREEGGLEAAVWTDIGRIDPFTTSVRGANFLFVAAGLRQVGQALEEGEQVEIVRMPFTAAVELAMSGAITHGTTCMLLLKTAELLRRHGGSFFGIG
ncbi:MAG TPA: NUDIX hydrolase [Bryobacteraceae bacterium]|nr:NUDIX hydrolase [Bryobacteraceae bacterium]